MKNKSKIIFTSILTFISLSIFSCNKLHIHNYEWKYDEDHHWQECIHCGQRIDVVEHSMLESNDTCVVCNYKDAVVFKDEEGTMTGLTKWAKKKSSITIPEDILYVGKESLKDSKAATITVHKPLIGIYEGAFIGSSIPHDTPEEAAKHIKTDEENVKWYKVGGIYYKYNESESKEAMVDGKFYSTLKEAIESIKEDGTTVTILTDKVTKPDKPIEVNYDIDLDANIGIEPNLNDFEFIIKPTGYLRIANSIKFEQGYVKLLLDIVKERVGQINAKETTGYTSGSLIFLDKTEEPDPNKLVVEYAKTEEDEETVIANGCLQKELIKECFVYGTFKMNKEMDSIIGLTDYGSSIIRLTINNPIKDKKFVIHDWAFTTPARIRIRIPIKDITIDLDLQKGLYRHLTIGKGITKIGYRAFSNWFDRGQIPPEIVKDLASLISPLTTLRIDDDLEEIGSEDFFYCAGLESVEMIGQNPNLKTVGVAAFQECLNLKTVDLSKCLQLTSIKTHAFYKDTSLTRLILPYDNGWNMGSQSGYRPEEIRSPSTAAYLASISETDEEWNRNVSAKFCYYDPAKKDNYGRYNRVRYVNDFETAYSQANEGNVIAVCDKDAKFDETININKSIQLLCCKDYEGATLRNVNVSPNKYVLIDPKLLKEESCVVLKCDGKDGEYKNVSSVGILRDENNTKNDNFDVFIANSDTQYEYPVNLKKGKLNNGNSYDLFGLFNFKMDFNDKSEKLNSLTSLAKSFVTELEVSKQLASTNEKLADNLFAGNDHIRKVTFGDAVYHIPRHTLADNISNTIEEAVFKQVSTFDYRSFYKCKKLSLVDFSEDKSLTELGEKCFGECPNLKEVVLPNDCQLKKINKEAFINTPLTKFDFANIKTKWKAGNHNFNDDELTPATAAKYLTNDYKSSVWTRNV